MNGITKLRYGLTIVLALLISSYLYSFSLGVISVGETATYEKKVAEVFYHLPNQEQTAVTKYYTALPDPPEHDTILMFLGLIMIIAIAMLVVITWKVWNAKEIRGEV